VVAGVGASGDADHRLQVGQAAAAHEAQQADAIAQRLERRAGAGHQAGVLGPRDDVAERAVEVQQQGHVGRGHAGRCELRGDERVEGHGGRG